MENEWEIVEQVQSALKHRRFQELKAMTAEMNPADIAAIMVDLRPEELLLFFRLLPKEAAAEAFADVDGDVQVELIKGFTDAELKSVMDELFIDDAVDMIEEMPANVVRRILKYTAPDVRQTINELLAYPKDSAGSVMTVEYVDLKPEMTVRQAFAHIRKTGVDKETIYTCYVVDSNRKLIGLVSVKDLLFADYEDKISEIMETNVVSVDTLEDKEIVAQAFSKYDFMALPVVDKESRLVGIVTFDDAMDVIEEETTEDIEKMAAIVSSDDDTPYLRTGVFSFFKQRIVWLMLLMVSSTFTSLIINGFESSLSACIVLTAFIPMLMGTGGNAGSQASVTIIRCLSLGEVDFKDLFKVIWKELRISLLCGTALALVNFGKMMLVDNWLMANPEVTWVVATIVSLSILLTIVAAKLVGGILPILADRIGIDPAVMASPFITTIVDVLSLLIYFGFASVALQL
ncbi:MAG: magnesium transporter [Clostridia bacterium]|nr:magnesium transporter [Clostridia bacterium]